MPKRSEGQGNGGHSSSPQQSVTHAARSWTAAAFLLMISFFDNAAIAQTFISSGWNGVSPNLPIGDQCVTGDFNGDGLTDLACQTAAGSGVWVMSLSTGSGFVTTSWN